MSATLNLAQRQSIAQNLRDEAEHIRLDCEDRMAKLFEAAVVIEGGASEESTASPSPAKPSVPRDGKLSVMDMVREAALTLEAAVTFDHRKIATIARAKHPTEEKKIATGIYNSFVRLTEAGEIKRDPGGWIRTDKMKVPVIPAQEGAPA